MRTGEVARRKRSEEETEEELGRLVITAADEAHNDTTASDCNQGARAGGILVSSPSVDGLCGRQPRETNRGPSTVGQSSTHGFFSIVEKQKEENK